MGAGEAADQTRRSRRAICRQSVSAVLHSLTEWSSSLDQQHIPWAASLLQLACLPTNSGAGIRGEARNHQSARRFRGQQTARMGHAGFHRDP